MTLCNWGMAVDGSRQWLWSFKPKQKKTRNPEKIFSNESEYGTSTTETNRRPGDIRTRDLAPNIQNESFRTKTSTMKLHPSFLDLSTNDSPWVPATSPCQQLDWFDFASKSLLGMTLSQWTLLYFSLRCCFWTLKCYSILPELPVDCTSWCGKVPNPYLAASRKIVTASKSYAVALIKTLATRSKTFGKHFMKDQKGWIRFTIPKILIVRSWLMYIEGFGVYRHNVSRTSTFRVNDLEIWNPICEVFKTLPDILQ